MKKILIALIALSASLLMLAAGTAFADTVGANFENPPYTVGNINGQNGWTKTGSYDVAVTSNTYGIPSFGSQVLRISNAVTSGSFGDQAFSMPLVNAAGEPGAGAGGFPIGTLQPHFEMDFDIASAVPGSQQTGLSMSVSPDRGDGSRMSYLRFEDDADGIEVYFDDVEGTSNPANFVETKIATLDRTKVHHVKLTFDAVSGPSNDVVKVWIDGSLVETGTSWENYYRYDSEASAEQNVRAVRDVLFREGGTATPANAGNGFLVDNLTLSSGPTPTSNTIVVTPAAMQGWAFVNDTTEGAGTGMMVTGPATPPLGTGSAELTATSTTDGQILALANPSLANVKLSDLTALSYSTYQNVSNPSNATAIALQFDVVKDVTVSNPPYQGRIIYEPYNNNGGTVPLGSWNTWDALNGGNGKWWFSDSATTHAHNFDNNCSQASPCTLDQIIALYPNIGINPDGVVALKAGSGWTSFDGNVDNLTIGVDDANTTYDFDPSPALTPSVMTNTATNVTASDATLNGTNGPVAADGESFWVSTSTINTSSPNIPAGVYSTPVLPAVGAGVSFADQLSLVTTNGIVTGGAPGNMSAITPNTTYYFVAWSHVNGTWYPGAVLQFTTGAAANVTVTIDKFIDGHMATAASADSMSFPMASSWVTTNIASGSGTYALAPTGFNSSNPYEAVTSQMNNGSSYTTNEVTTGNAVVGASCAAGEPYMLAGYTTGASEAAAEAATPSMTAPSFTNITQNEYVIVWNKTCLAAPTLLTPPNGTSTTTAGLTGTSWSAVTDPAGGITYVYQSANASTTNPDGSFTTPAYTSGPLTATNEPTPNTPAGNYWWHVQAKDADGNLSPWSTVWTFTVNNTVTTPPPPATACNTPGTAPAGYKLQNGKAGNPSVTLSPFTMYVGMAGNPKISGSAGNYIVCLSNGNATVTLGDGSDTIAAGNGNQSITVGSGGSGSSTITVGNGNSVINSTDSGSQSVTAGNGNNTITTGSGNDTISAGNGNNKINAAGGTDSCTVGAGKSTLTSCNP